jgi:hypothetical protein
VIFGAKNLYTTNEILDSILKTGDIKDSTGAVSITKKDGRKTVASGRIFFRNELIYAVEIANKEIPIGNRVETGGLVDIDDLEAVFRKVGSKTSPRIVDQLLVSQLISEKNINNYVKEHFIETLGEILSWDNSTGEWHPNTTTSDFTMPYVALDKIRAILENRATFRKEFATAVRSFFRDTEIDNLTFVNTTKDITQFPAEIRAILRRADGEYTAETIAQDTGIGQFAVFQSAISLWKKGVLSLRLGGIDLPFASLQESIKPEPPKSEQEQPEESFVPLASDADDVIQEDPEDSAVKADQAVAEEFVNATDEYSDEEPNEEETENDESVETEESKEDDSIASDKETEVVFNENVTDFEDTEESYITEDDIVEPEASDDNEFIVTDDEHEESESHHFTNLPSFDETFAAPVAGTVASPVESNEPDEEFDVIEEEITTEPEEAPQTEGNKTLPVNTFDANVTLIEFTVKLNELQGELSAIATEISDAKAVLENHEDKMGGLRLAVEEAQRNLSHAENEYAVAQETLSGSEKKYEEAVFSIERLVQSFKLSS